MSATLRELVRRKLINNHHIDQARAKRVLDQRPLQDLLIDAGHLDSKDLYDTAQKAYACPAVNLDDVTIDVKLVRLIPSKNAVFNGVFPVKKQGKDLFLAMSDPSDIFAWDEIGFLTHFHIKPMLCAQPQLSAFIRQYYQAESTVHDILGDTIDNTPIISKEQLSKEAVVDIAKSQSDDSSFIRLLNKIICDAVDARASDVHIEPQEKGVEVRYRIDGYLKSIIHIPRNLHPRLSARIKILAKMDIAEQNRVQEGRVNILMEGRKLDLRVSMVPLYHGEKIVLRILDLSKSQYNLDYIGFQEDDLAAFKEMIHKSTGMILITGPTGSGKTTTLYSALQEIRSETKNIVTIEDPIEYLMEGVNQVQLNRHKDITFANGLRSLLRQDPDVILVGEIRDRETADIAFRASLTGHLVFSTLHTNNAVSTITRLQDIGLEPYLLSSSIIMLVAQRLVRLICPNCCEACAPDEALLNKFSDYLNVNPIEHFYHGKGCEYCNHSGYFGRTSIFEVLRVNDQIRNLIFNKSSEALILREAKQNGMKTLVEAGLNKVAAGLTTLNEVAKVVDVSSGLKDTFDFNYTV